MNQENAKYTTPHPTTDDQRQELKKINIYTTINQPEMSWGKIHSDQTGRFPIQSFSGNKYMMFIYAYYPNAILVEPLHYRTRYSILQAYQNVIGQLTKREFEPRIQRVYNEA